MRVCGAPLALANARPEASTLRPSANSSRSITTLPAAVFKIGRRSSDGGDASARTTTATGATSPAPKSLPHRSDTAPARTSSETGRGCCAAPARRPLLTATHAFCACVRATAASSEPAHPAGAARGAPSSGRRIGAEEDAPPTTSASDAGVPSSALTYSSNRTVSTPLPMSSAGGLDGSSAGGRESGTTATGTPPVRPTAAPYPPRRLPDRSAANPSSRSREAGAPNPRSADASTASIRAAFWSGAIRAMTVSPPAPADSVEWPASGMRWRPSPPAEPSNTATSMYGIAAGAALEEGSEPWRGQDAAGATPSSKWTSSVPADRSRTGSMDGASTDGGIVSGATLRGAACTAGDGLPARS